jgi:hypothetical protein
MGRHKNAGWDHWIFETSFPNRDHKGHVEETFARITTFAQNALLDIVFRLAYCPHP